MPPGAVWSLILLDVKKGSEDVCSCAQVSYLCIAYLQCACVQLFDPGVMCGHQHTILPPQDGGGGVSWCHTVEDHCAVHSYSLIGGALSDNWWRPVWHNCERRITSNYVERWREKNCGGVHVLDQRQKDQWIQTVTSSLCEKGLREWWASDKKRVAM